MAEIETNSIIGVAVARAVRETPDEAAALMVQFMRENARLEAELFCLRHKLLALGRGVVVVEP
jgi:hypothetical protein